MDKEFFYFFVKTAKRSFSEIFYQLKANKITENVAQKFPFLPKKFKKCGEKDRKSQLEIDYFTEKIENYKRSHEFGKL